MPIEMLSGFTANISMETQIQQNRRYTTIQLDIIHTGDCLEIMKTLPDDSVHCCVTVPFPVSWTVKMKKKQKETQDILSYHTQAAGCSDKARAKASGGRQPIEECGRTGL